MHSLAVMDVGSALAGLFTMQVSSLMRLEAESTQVAVLVTVRQNPHQLVHAAVTQSVSC